ncbi:MAG: cyclophane-forming radical SAM/SPASM peptide maturase GrrM/OscB [Xenococcus sp. MO_188.B8]|nr:cyclophane-forming radical SAM/SPASM peptide maturase GrrM/OscB [Xenococcus sp. MO_188.B8]
MFKNIKNIIDSFFFNKVQFGPLRLLVIQPTTFCNLDCSYCYLPDRKAKYKLSLDLLEPIFQKLFSSQLVDKGFTVVWHAGEPLTVPISFYRLACNKIEQLNQEINSKPYDIYHSVQTNGTLITQAWCEFFKEYKIRVGVSLDGPAFIHDAYRKTRTGIGTHTGTMRGISLLQKNKIDFSIIAVLTDKSLDYPDEIFNFFREHRIRNVGFNVEEIEGRNRCSSLQKLEVEERYRNFMERLYELVKETEGDLRVREFDDTKRLICSEGKKNQGQGTPFSMINIAYNGDFSTFSPELLSYGDFIIGNVLHDDFESVAKNDKFQRINQDIQTGVKLCHETCPYFSVCGGGAPSNKYFENGSFRTTETLYCKYTIKTITDIVLEDIEIDLGLRQ